MPAPTAKMESGNATKHDLRVPTVYGRHLSIEIHAHDVINCRLASIEPVSTQKMQFGSILPLVYQGNKTLLADLFR